MAIRIFIYSLLVISIISVFSTVNSESNSLENNDMALLTFNDSTMYTLNNKKVTRIVQSKKIVRYEDRDEMYNGTFISRGKSNNNTELSNVISADFIEKKASKVKFENNVNYNGENFISFKTDISTL
mgnify:CR=1 FL=1